VTDELVTCFAVGHRAATPLAFDADLLQRSITVTAVAGLLPKAPGPRQPGEGRFAGTDANASSFGWSTRTISQRPRLISAPSNVQRVDR
jgi:hypothetical protein